MYEHVGILPRDRTNELAEIARTLIPDSCAGSFIVPFPQRVELSAYPTRCIAGVAKVVGLLPSQQIALHADQSIAPAVRYHVVLRTNDQCWSFSEIWQKLYERTIYRMDPAVPHGAVNWGETVRLHLMIDVEGS